VVHKKEKRMPRPLIQTILAFLMAVSAARADCSVGTISVSFSPSNGGTCTVLYNTQYAKYDVNITRSSTVSSTVTVNVRGTSSDDLHNVTITTSSAFPTWVSVGEATSRFETVDAVSRSGSGTGDVVLLDLYVAGSLGVFQSTNKSVDVNQANTIQIGGDVLSPIAVTTASLNDLHVSGSLSSSVTVSNGAINSLTVDGDIDSGALVRAKNGIKLIRSAANHGTIDTKYNGGSGDLWYLETTAGNFDGSLATHAITSSISPSGLSIAGDLKAPVTVTGDVTEPIVVTGNLDALLSVGGSIAAGAEVSIGLSVRYSGSNSGKSRRSAWRARSSSTITTPPRHLGRGTGR
jgi:hypothetical protein